VNDLVVEYVEKAKSVLEPSELLVLMPPNVRLELGPDLLFILESMGKTKQEIADIIYIDQSSYRNLFAILLHKAVYKLH